MLSGNSHQVKFLTHISQSSLKINDGKLIYNKTKGLQAKAIILFMAKHHLSKKMQVKKSLI